MPLSTRGGRRLSGRALLSLAFATAASASAQVTYTVDSVLDQIDDDTTDGICHTAANTCTLRAAVMQANLASGAGATILLSATTYTLVRPAAGANGPDNGDLNLTTPASGNPVISIVGAGEAATTIDANQIDRVLSVGAVRTATLSHLTLRNGFLSGAGIPTGAGIHNQGFLTLDHCTVTANVIDANFGHAGGIHHLDGTLFLKDSTVSANAGNHGGGIYSEAYLTVLRSTIDGNTADASLGGGIYSTNSLTVTDSTISRNGAKIDGGGIASVEDGTLIMSNSTITLNNADRNGGGIFTTNANIYSSTIAFNGADADHDLPGGLGGGVYVDAGGSFAMSNTLVVGNALVDSLVYDDCYGPITSYRANLFWEVGGLCAITVGGGDGWSYLNSLSLLAPLQKNGGVTETIALLPGSNAIDSGDSTLGCTGPAGPPLPTDQRGVPRIAGVRCDVGAFEEGILFFDGFETADLSAW